jgi:hypothetical protein
MISETKTLRHDFEGKKYFVAIFMTRCEKLSFTDQLGKK